MGNACPGRQILATPEIGLAQEEEVVGLSLLAPGCIALVFAKLMVTQALEGFALPPCLLKDFLLLVPQSVQSLEFLLQSLPLLAESRGTREREAQFSAAGAAAEVLRLRSVELLQAAFDLLNQVTNPGAQLVGGAQPQFLLVFDAFAVMKDSLERKVKGHGVLTW